MKVLLQRVTRASVSIEGKVHSRIGPGLLALVGIERADHERTVETMLDKLLHYRVFDDGAGRMNLDLLSVGGELMLVSQFTLAADTGKGRRPGFSLAAEPERAERLFEHLCLLAESRLPLAPARGVFGAHMAVELLNDGPVTFLLEVQSA